ncbi:MAG: hypothetical protein ABNH00_00510 [Dokdonia sp.]|jgi:hypothetical protein
MKAVITGDLVHSTQYDREQLSAVLNMLKKEFSHLEHARFRMFRGDSFQGVVDRIELALLYALRIRTAIARMEFSDSKIRTDARIAIGLGTIDFTRDSILESNGVAFRHSGAALDEMKDSAQRMSLRATTSAITEEFKVSLALLDGLMSKWGIASHEVVYYLTKDYKEQQIAEIIGISQAAVNARKKVVQWDAIKLLLQRYATVTQNMRTDDR